MTPTDHHVIVIGAGTAGRCVAAHLLGAGITDFVVLEAANRVLTPGLDTHVRPGQHVTSSVFDDNTDTWSLTTESGQSWRARVVIATHRAPYVPWIPNIPGHSDFHGTAFHAGAWAQDFDPTDKRIAVIGVDAHAGRCLDLLVRSAESVSVFAHFPRRFVADVPLPSTRVARWLRHRLPVIAATQARPKPTVEPVLSALEAITASGVRTRDANGYRDHRVDAIIYGTGFTIAEQVRDETLVGAGGLTLRQAWRQGMEPYLGVAIYGFPNYFLNVETSGPDLPNSQAQTRYIIECLHAMQRSDSTRIQLRRSNQQVYNERVHLTRPPQPMDQTAFDLVSHTNIDDEIYDGPATLTIADHCRRVRVRLTGHVDPIDGQYHWQGTVFDSLSDEALKQMRAVTLTIDQHSAPARIVEQTPWGTRSVAGVGEPPFALSPAGP